MTLTGSVRLAIGVLGIVALAACDSAEERAEEHYQNGLELLEAGDVDRALVEFRNVFELNGNHRDARALYAATVLEQGDVRQAFSQYLRLVEQHPEDLETRVILTEMAIESRNWLEADRHWRRALELNAEDPDVQVIDTIMRYRDASAGDQDQLRQEIIDKAAAMVVERPEKNMLHSVVIDGAMWQRDFDRVLELVDIALESHPERQEFYLFRLAALEQLGEAEAAEEAMLDLARRFPDQAQYRTMVLQYYRQRGEPEKAEDFIRSIVSPRDENPSEYVAFVRYLRDTRGIEVAIDELEDGLAKAPSQVVFLALRASLLFDQGLRDEGLAQMQALIRDDGDPNEQRRFKIALGQMLLTMGNDVGARKLVEEVLAEDATNVEAIKLQASWLIDRDETAEAISLLRTALDQAPNDADIMTLIASAHARNGDTELARDLLSLAAETSGFAVEESLRYAQFLVAGDELLAAEDLLINALRRTPNNIPLLNGLGGVYVQMEDWARAEHVEQSLRALADPSAKGAADGIRFALLNARDQEADALSFVTELATSEAGNFRALAVAVQSLIVAGELEEARGMVAEAIENNPERTDLNYLRAALESTAGDLGLAEEQYLEIIEQGQDNERIWVELVRIANRQGEPAKAEDYLARGLDRFPDGPNLLWAQASTLEQKGDYDGAIDIYERLYDVSSRSTIVSNNLASLLATHRADEESIDRAYRISRRLRDSDNPAFQDTYGWLSYLRGEYGEALQNLEPAALGLPNDPLVQYHLGMTYEALGRDEAAAEQFRKVIELASESDTRPQIASAREKLNTIEGADQ